MNSYRYHMTIGLASLLMMFLIVTGCSENASEAKIDTASTQAPPPLSVVDREKSPETTPVNADGKVPKIAFTETVHDFGKQIAGPDLSVAFSFKNTGDGVLLIESVKAG